METMLNEAILQSKKMKKEFLIEFSQYKDQIPEYDGLIKQYDNIEKNLQEKKKSLGSLQNNIEKAKQKNKQKQMEYLN